MEYQVELTIDLPRARVAELFDSFDNLKKWQKGLKHVHPLSGVPGEDGARTRLVYDMGRKDFEMIETIIKREMPDRFDATYETRGVKNWVSNTFVEEGGHTRWINHNVFKMSGFMVLVNLMGKKPFIRQTTADMNRFKEWAEGQG